MILRSRSWLIALEPAGAAIMIKLINSVKTRGIWKTANQIQSFYQPLCIGLRIGSSVPQFAKANTKSSIAYVDLLTFVLLITVTPGPPAR